MAKIGERTSESHSVEDLLKINSKLSGLRDERWSVWEDCLYYFMPEQQNIFQQKQHISEHSAPINPIGQRASNLLASGIFSNTVNMGDNFFQFKIEDPTLEGEEELKDWLRATSTKVLQQMQSSNFANSAFEFINYLVVLNTAVFYSEYDDTKGLIFKNYPCHNCSIAEDSDGMVNTVYREFQYDACQAVEHWGIDNVSEDVRKAYNDDQTGKKYELRDYIHAVFPRKSYDEESNNSKELPFASYYIDVKAKHIVEESGYRQFPYQVGRFFRDRHSCYGRGVSFTALATMRELQILTATITDGVELRVNPPIFLPSGQSDLDVDLTPGSVNVYNSLTGARPYEYQSNIDLASATEREAKKEKEVIEMFYADLFMALEEHKNMTATEVNQRIAEKIQTISPVVSRIFDEFYSPAILRQLYLLFENGQLDELPEGFNIYSLSVEYTDKLSQKLDQLEISQIMKSVEEASAVILGDQQTQGELGLYLNKQETIAEIFRRNGTEPKMLFSKRETKKMIEARAQALAEQQQAEQMQGSLAPIDLQQRNEKDSVIDQMMSG